MEVIEVTEREVEVIEVIERGPQGPAGAGITTLTTQGDLLYRGATTGERLPIGTVGQLLKVNSGATAPQWATISPADIGAATAAQGALADTAVQPEDILPVYLAVKNTSGVELTKGTPIYTTGSVGDTSVATVSAARADDSSKVAVAILNQTLSNNGTGTATIIGELTGVNTNSLTKGNVYLAPTGGLTNTKPTNTSHFVQWLGTAERINTNSGVLFINVTAPRTPDEAFAASSHTHSNATTSIAGFMSSTDKTKLDGIASGAEVNVNADWNAASGDAQILNKPTIPSASSATPSALGVAAAGTSSNYARADHVHVMPSAADVGAAETSHTHVSSDITDATSEDIVDTLVLRDGDGKANFRSIKITNIPTEPNAGAAYYTPIIIDDEGTISTVGTKGPEVRSSLGLGTTDSPTFTALTLEEQNENNTFSLTPYLENNEIFVDIGFNGNSAKTFSESNLPVVQNDLGTAATADIGTGAGDVCAGDDARLSDTRDPNAHAASHEGSGSDPVSLTFYSQISAAVLEDPSAARSDLGLGDAATADSTDFAAASHTHGNLTNDGKVGSTAGLPLVTTTAGAVTTLALGTANQVLRVNSGATGVEFGAGFDAASPPAIGNTTPNSGAFTTLSANNGTLTASAPVLDLSQTWNNAAVTFTGIQFNITNTASVSAASGSKYFEIAVGGVPQIRFQRNFSTPYLYFGNTDTGVGAGSTTLNIICNGGVAAQIGSGSLGIYVRADAPYQWSSTTGFAAADLQLFRDAADTLAQRRTTNPQTFRIYNTFTDASNYERGFMRWSSNVFQIGTEVAGTGSPRNIEIVGNTTFNNNVTIAGGRVLGASQINLNSTSTALLALGTDSLIRWGASNSTTTPALKRSSTTLQVRLADDSADAPLSSASLTSGDGTRTSLAYLFAADTDTGFYRRATNTFTFVANNANIFEIVSNGVRLEVNSSIQWAFNDLSGSSDLSLFRDAADILAQRRGLNAQAFRLYNTFTSSTNFERLNIRWASSECIIDAEAGSGGGTLRGIKIGSATSSLLGFYGATPVDRPATVADPTGGGTIDAEARTAINDIIDRLQELGLIA